jgi:hypothetical protein
MFVTSPDGGVGPVWTVKVFEVPPRPTKNMAWIGFIGPVPLLTLEETTESTLGGTKLELMRIILKDYY